MKLRCDCGNAGLYRSYDGKKHFCLKCMDDRWICSKCNHEALHRSVTNGVEVKYCGKHWDDYLFSYGNPLRRNGKSK
jgi:hypothetical protein